ncbi:helix-turn-helix domain-containing protein [Actinoplanes sp. CA-015351]|uniref:helix-turn-helix domain-containing protein n=1 Tax=Actinoplanes sp. CA-015351 TaxID=3239897 RepID=UPI003D9573BA
MVDMPARLLSDMDTLKAFAHPLRQRMLTRLHRHGPATSADLAVEFDADRGATSYHLRQLARYGFIEEDAALSAGRRKYWKFVPQDLRLPRDFANPDVGAVVEEIGRQWLERADRDLTTYLTDRASYGEFAAAAQHSFGATVLTAEELERFGEEYIAFLNRWHRTPDELPAGARPITVLFHAFPTPEAASPSPEAVASSPEAAASSLGVASSSTEAAG